jgi:iron complex outermembrane receptor protein
VTLTTGALYYHQLSRKFPSGVDAGLGRARSGPFRVYPGFLVPFAGQAIGSRGRLTKIKMESEAVYGQGEFHVLPAVDLVLGLRYTEDKKNGVDNSVVSGVNPNPIAIAYKADQTTYNAGVNYKWSFDRMVYAKYSTGYISGGALGTFVYAPELAKSLEAGIKADWLDGRLRTNLAVFQVKYTDVQFPVAGNTLTPPRPEVTQATVNAGDAKASGFELETSLAPIRPLLLTANVGYTDFKFTRLNPQLTNGNAEYLPIFRPKWNATVSGQYTGGSFLEGVDFVARLDGAWRSRQNGTAGIPLTSASFSAAEQAAYKAAATIHPYWIWNGRLALQGIKLGGANATLALWSRNLFDEKSPSLVQSLVTVIAADYEPARTVGLDFTLAF